MRPVQRGDVPIVSGVAKEYAQYRDANADLEIRIGKYCAYCERRFDSMLEVEHLSPKSRDREGLADWHNFLLSCKICNTVKQAKPTDDESFLWPDRDNTFRAIEYRVGGFVAVSGGIDQPNQDRARKLVDLVGLDRHQQRGWPDPTDRDCRWETREKVWSFAERTKRRHPNPSDDDADYIAENASLIGFFSVWMTVFGDVPRVRRRLVYWFQAAGDCFDADGNAIPRAGGRV